MDRSRSYKPVWSDAYVSDIDDEPELSTTPEWRRIMVSARKTKRDGYPDGMTQGQLGDLVGCSQVMISKIEGADGASKYVRRICRALSIPLPQHFVDEPDRSWSQLGHVLRRKDPEQYKILLAQVELAAKRAAESAAESTPDEPAEIGDRRK